MEYIDNEITTILSHGDNEILVSIFKQIMLFVVVLGINYKISHGDLHTGNILLRTVSSDKVNKYVVLDKIVNVNTLGYEPVIIDFQRSKIYKRNNLEMMLESIVDDIALVLDVLANYLPSHKKTIIKNLAISEINSWNISLEFLLNKIDSFGQTLGET